MVEAKVGVSPAHQILLYSNKEMQDCNTLADYPPLTNQSNIFLVAKLKGGSMLEKLTSDIELLKLSLEPKRTIDKSLPKRNDYCPITGCDFVHDGVMVLEMPCGHPMSSDGLMDYCWNEVTSGRKSEIKCPLCESEWSLAVIKRYGGISAEELGLLEVGLSRNLCDKNSDIKQCPKCLTYCTRQNPNDFSVECIICKPKYHFCWHCLKKWKTSFSSSNCGNSPCKDAEILALLRDCGRVKVAYLNDTTVFKYRACVHCGTLIELSGGCKHMKCKACETEFCFICLRKRTPQGSWFCGSHESGCKEAPIQTVIPCK